MNFLTPDEAAAMLRMRAADNIDIPEIFMGQCEMPFPISYGILNAKRLERMRKVLLEAQGQLAGASQL